MAMEDIKVTPRVLADDLFYTTFGVGHRARCVRAMLFSRQFFEDIGAKVANNKCFTFATDLHTRSSLAAYIWNADGLRIPCKHNFRDLGTHLNLAQNRCGLV